jgi:hypothetical protein
MAWGLLSRITLNKPYPLLDPGQTFFFGVCKDIGPRVKQRPLAHHVGMLSF